MLLLAFACAHAPPAVAVAVAEVRFSDVVAVELTDVADVHVVAGRVFVFAGGDLVALGPDGAVRWRVPAMDADHVRFSADASRVVVCSAFGCVSRVDVGTGDVVSHPLTVNPDGWDVDDAGEVAWGSTWLTPRLVGRRFDDLGTFDVEVSRDEGEGGVWVDGELALILGSDDLVVRSLPSGDEVARTPAGDHQVCGFAGGVVGLVDGDRHVALDARSLERSDAPPPCVDREWVDVDGGWASPQPDGSAWVLVDETLRKVSRTTRSVTSAPAPDHALGDGDGRHVVIDDGGWLRAEAPGRRVVDRLRVDDSGVIEATWAPEVGFTVWIDDTWWVVGPAQ